MIKRPTYPRLVCTLEEKEEYTYAAFLLLRVWRELWNHNCRNYIAMQAIIRRAASLLTSRRGEEEDLKLQKKTKNQSAKSFLSITCRHIIIFIPLFVWFMNRPHIHSSTRFTLLTLRTVCILALKNWPHFAALLIMTSFRYFMFLVPLLLLIILRSSCPGWQSPNRMEWEFANTGISINCVAVDQ